MLGNLGSIHKDKKMDRKIIGYILMGAGVLVFLFSYPGIRALFKLPSIPGVTDTIIMIAALALIGAGAYLSFRKPGREQPSEVPIYEGHGKERRVVAIQRMGKK